MFKSLLRGGTQGRRGFTIVELILIVVVLAVLAAILLPKFMKSTMQSKEYTLRGDLNVVRNAVSLFQAETGLYPRSLRDLTRTSAPDEGLDSQGSRAAINPQDWHGPYLQELPKDCIAGTDFRYSTTPPTVGKVSSAATGNGSNHTPYNTW